MQTTQRLKKRLPKRPKRIRNPEHVHGMEKDLTARAMFIKCPASKAIIRARTLKGLPVARAMAVLKMSPTSSARYMAKVLNAAIAAASKGKSDRNVDSLTVESFQIGQAPSLKRHHPVSHGMAKPILKRSCHMFVKLRYDDPSDGFSDGPGGLRRRMNDPTGEGKPAPQSNRARRAAQKLAKLAEAKALKDAEAKDGPGQ
ncbi:MAG: uL22 family ribosomal protein [Deltaproteobacteria bacterium]|jgi:large subunit ribosomal protein L22|nr:uL22 family ribosomal protein [Deltaproteobacteria bacterium]